MVPVPLYFRIRATSICGSALYHCASKYWKSFELVDFESQTPGVKVDQSCGARFVAADPARFGTCIVYLCCFSCPQQVSEANPTKD